MALSGDSLWLARRGGGEPVRVPAYVAVATADGRVLAVGEEARAMSGHEPGNIAVVSLSNSAAMRDEPELLAHAVRVLLRQHCGRSLLPARVVFVAEPGVHTVINTAVLQGGAREVLLLDPPMAAAIGAGLKIEEPVPRAVLVLERHTCSFAVISLAGVVAGFAATQGVGRLLDDVALHTLATQRIALDVERLDAAVRRSGLAGSEAIGWEAWLNEVVTGRVMAAALAEPDVHRVSQPFQYWLAWQHRRAFETLPPARRVEAEAATVQLVGPYARATGIKELVGAALNRPVVVPEQAEACLVLGAQAVLADLGFLLSYVAKRRGRVA
jgi:rod shape-determining protein MreB